MMFQNAQSFKKIISSSGINLLFRMFGLATSFFSTMLITRLFGLSDFGNYSLIFTICQATTMIFALGLPTALIKIVGNQDLNIQQAKKLLKQGMHIILIFAAFPVTLFYFCAEFISESIFGNSNLTVYFQIVAIVLPLTILHELFLYFFMATRKFLKFNLFMFVLPNVLLIAFLYTFFLMGFSGHYTFVAFLLSVILVILVEAIVIFEFRPKRIDKTISSRELLKTASPMMFSSLLLYLLNWTDVIVLGMMVDEKEVGIYNIAYKVGSVGFLVIVSVSTITTPMMAQLFGQKNFLGLQKLVQDSTKLIAVLTIPVVLVLILLSNFILSIFNSEAVQGQATLIIISLGVLFSAMAGNVDQVLNMTDNQNLLKNITFFCFFVNLGLNLVLIPIYGINGSAAASLITNVVLNLVCVWYIKKKLGFYTISLKRHQDAT